MGKITSKDADKLKKSGILSEAALNEMQNKGLVSKGRKHVKRFFTKLLNYIVNTQQQIKQNNRRNKWL